MRSINVSSEELGLSVTVDLHIEDNAESVASLSSALPFVSSFGHTVISGGGIWIPTRIVHLGATAPRRRSIGSVYLYGPMQILALTYGQISESAFVNEVGRVRQGDLGVLAELGRLVWERTIASKQSLLTPVRVEGNPNV